MLVNDLRLAKFSHQLIIFANLVLKVFLQLDTIFFCFGNRENLEKYSLNQPENSGGKFQTLCTDFGKKRHNFISYRSHNDTLPNNSLKPSQDLLEASL